MNFNTDAYIVMIYTVTILFLSYNDIDKINELMELVERAIVSTFTKAMQSIAQFFNKFSSRHKETKDNDEDDMSNGSNSPSI